MTAEEGAPGRHRWVITMDEERVVCTAQIAGEAPQVQCEGTVEMVLSARMEEFDEVSGGTSVAHGWRTVPDAFTSSISILGTPQHVRVEHMREELLVSEHQAALRYESTWPNGPSCGPCRRAEVQW